MSSVRLDDVEISIINSPSTEAIQTDSLRNTSQGQRHAIKCFRHCSEFVFCFEFPDCCPVCGADLLSSEIIVPPFVYRSPLESEHRKCASILVRPARGKSFLHDYSNGDYLHCGVVDEDGIVHDFDETGLHVSTEWLNCIHIPLDVSTRQPIKHQIVHVKGEWSKLHSRYNSITANCFTFVLFCLKRLGYYSEMSEGDFITEIILPRTSETAKYITLYRKLTAGGGIYIKPDNEPATGIS